MSLSKRDLEDVQRHFVLRRFEVVLSAVAEVLSPGDDEQHFAEIGAKDRTSWLPRDWCISKESTTWEASAPWVVLALQSLYELGRTSSIMPYLRTDRLMPPKKSGCCRSMNMAGAAYADPDAVPPGVVYAG